MYTFYFVSNHQDRHQATIIKWAVYSVTTDGHFNLPLKFVWAYMDERTHFITLKGNENLTHRYILNIF